MTAGAWTGELPEERPKAALRLGDKGRSRGPRERPAEARRKASNASARTRPYVSRKGRS